MMRLEGKHVCALCARSHQLRINRLNPGLCDIRSEHGRKPNATVRILVTTRNDEGKKKAAETQPEREWERGVVERSIINVNGISYLAFLLLFSGHIFSTRFKCNGSVFFTASFFHSSVSLFHKELRLIFGRLSS